VHDPADHAPVIGALDTSHILRQMRFNPCPLLVAQPEQISAHRFFPNTNQYRIVQTENLMSSDPSERRFDLDGDPLRDLILHPDQNALIRAAKRIWRSSPKGNHGLPFHLP
jgi:hypothetical protein